MGGFDGNFFDYVLGRSGDVIGTLLQQAGAGHGLGQASDPFSNNGYFTSLADRIVSNKYQQQRSEAQYQQKPGQQGQKPPAPASGQSPSFQGMLPGNDFISSILPLAQAAEQRTGVPAIVSAAVAANETGMGAAPQGGQRWNSYHGIRGTGPAGTTPGGFRANNTPQESFDDFANLITQEPRYAPAWQQYQQDRDTQQLVSNIAAAGYATQDEAPAWIRQVSSLIARAGAAQAALQSQQALQPSPAAQTVIRGNARAGAVTSSGYSFPVLGYQGQVALHHGSVRGGSDIFAPEGTPVVAMRGGTVISARYDNTGGNTVFVQGDDGNQYYYAHLRDGPLVGPGRVETGQPLGFVGQTGNARGTGAHLHIGIGPAISNGVGPYGGTGGEFDAVGLLQRALGGQ